jgi:uncharacterized protein (DUF2147 family)
MKNILKFYILLPLIIVLLFAGFKPSEADKILGKWQESTEVRTIEIYKKGGMFYGKILENKHADEDGLKPGVEMMQGFSYDEKDKVWCGETFLPSKDMHIKTKLTLNEGILTSVAKVMFIRKSKTWNKIK